MAADPFTLVTIPNGVAGVRATLRRMKSLAVAGKVDPTVRALAEKITSGLGYKDKRGEIDAVFRWVKNNVRYLRDIRGVETLSTPERLIRVRTGDCDDMATLTAALLESIGNRTRFVALGFDGGEYSHVIVEVVLGRGWLPLDCTVDSSFLGWYPQNVTRRMEHHL